RFFLQPPRRLKEKRPPVRSGEPVAEPVLQKGHDGSSRPLFGNLAKGPSSSIIEPPPTCNAPPRRAPRPPAALSGPHGRRQPLSSRFRGAAAAASPPWPGRGEPAFARTAKNPRGPKGRGVEEPGRRSKSQVDGHRVFREGRIGSIPRSSLGK